jgi:hypothetical protein
MRAPRAVWSFQPHVKAETGGIHVLDDVGCNVSQRVRLPVVRESLAIFRNRFLIEFHLRKDMLGRDH